MTAAVNALLEQIRRLTPDEQLEIIRGVAGLVAAGLGERKPAGAEPGADPVLELLGAYANTVPLIDDIPASTDPDLYLAAEASGAQAKGLHAWEIAPARYERGPDGRAVRKE